MAEEFINPFESARDDEIAKMFSQIRKGESGSTEITLDTLKTQLNFTVGDELTFYRVDVLETQSGYAVTGPKVLKVEITGFDRGNYIINGEYNGEKLENSILYVNDGGMLKIIRGNTHFHFRISNEPLLIFRKHRQLQFPQVDAPAEAAVEAEAKDTRRRVEQLELFK